MNSPNEQPTYSDELKRVRQLSEAHDEMKRVLDGVIRPVFNDILRVFIHISCPYDIQAHGHGVILNFGRPDKPFTVAYYGYPEDMEFELAISTDHETTKSCRIPFCWVLPGRIKKMFEDFFTNYTPDILYKADYNGHEVYDLAPEGPYQLRIEDNGASSVVAEADEFQKVLDMASVIQNSFNEKNLIITDRDGELIC
ncbi:MAG: hypothetical protein ACSHX6_15480 [Akkermansiaceae bacterium]